MREALWYEKLADRQTACGLCPHRCRLQPGKRGICRVRYNEGGVLYTRNYGQCSPLALDPIEKKPLYHFFPGSLILSVGTVGCNFKCRFCQNHELAHGDPFLYRKEPETLAALAKEHQRNGSVGIAYTYSEPIVWYEFIKETAELIQAEGLVNVLVTNGFIEEEPLAALLPHIDALNIDVKGFSQKFYREMVKGDYLPVLRTAEQAYKAGKHVEITTLLIPGLNDQEEEIRQLVGWLAGKLGPEVPLHFSRYVPRYQLDLPPTPAKTLLKAKEIARERLHYVYLGNAPELKESNTYCPECKEPVIERTGYGIRIRGLAGNRCAYCGAQLNIIC
ncbi:MAG: AmmeMemoRadiSam system radical SAM enzyme [Clostridia bacterium]|nr:AmmeMemoRadiSam system radical SAM enzyme [Clostridia bacterium]